MWPIRSIQRCTERGSRLFTISMRICSFTCSVHAAHSRNTAPNSIHCSSSQAFEETLNSLRMMALTVATNTAAKISHAAFFPIWLLIVSMTRLSLSNPCTFIPPPARPLDGCALCMRAMSRCYTMAEGSTRFRGGPSPDSFAAFLAFKAQCKQTDAGESPHQHNQGWRPQRHQPADQHRAQRSRAELQRPHQPGGRPCQLRPGR